MSTPQTKLSKPLLRGHFHQEAFFFSLGACVMLLMKTHNFHSFLATFIYSLGLCGLFAISALYHRPTWSPAKRAWMKRLDHAAIYIMIAGTGTPICMMALPLETGTKLLILTWSAALFGIFQSLFWVTAPKWVSSILYIIAGCLVIPYLSELHVALGTEGVALLLIGGFFFIVGAVIYAVKRPNPWPKTFGYHEIFHLLVIVGAIFHFMAVYRMIN